MYYHNYYIIITIIIFITITAIILTNFVCKIISNLVKSVDLLGYRHFLFGNFKY